MDTRLLIVLIPVLAAASWAFYNIGRILIQQLKKISS
nr:photosystem II protein Y [Galdieria phlegrea]WDA99836.1 photosystem II protein Y [Galdieria phlegrea]